MAQPTQPRGDSDDAAVETMARRMAQLALRGSDETLGWRDAGYRSAEAAAAVLVGDSTGIDEDVRTRAIAIVAAQLIEHDATPAATTARYRVVFDGSRERYLADTLSLAGGYGRVISTTDRYDGDHDLALIEIAADEAEYLERMLEDDDRVLSYRIID